MKSIIIIAIIIVSVFAINLDDSMNDYSQQVINQYCPYVKLNGIQECQNSTNNQHLSAMIGIGFNPFTMETKTPVLLMTYSGNKTFNEKTVPDQINLTPNDVTQSSVNVNNYITVKEWIENNNYQTGTGNCAGGLYSHSQDLISFYNTYFNNDLSLIVIQDWHTSFTITQDTSTKLVIHPLVQLAIDILPDTYDFDSYALFDKYWGTVINMDSSYGGMAEQTIMMKKCFWDSGVDIDGQVNMDLLIKLYPSQYTEANLDVNYKDHRQSSSTDIIGGNPELIDPSQWSERIQSFNDNPSLLTFKYIPIWTFITDPVKQQNFKQYLTDSVNNYNQQKQQQIQQAYAKPVHIYMAGTIDLISRPETFVNSFICSANQQYILETDLVVSSSYSTTPSINVYEFGCINMFSIQCNRDNTNKIQTVITNITPFKGLSPVTTGEWVNKGCSVSYVSGIWGINPEESMTLNAYCCLDCTPTVTFNNPSCSFCGSNYNCACPGF